ncbi:class I SAM-dependent methyltransferase [Tenacibaculum sp. MEBiC06402]|uniref:class I SAM-dependent methyltransferase n=1 Tax=unclassified Tenacibaculum TaxID=2635139 RepID=UPI003B99AEB9
MITQENIITNSSEYIITEDYSLTGEKFQLKKNSEYDMLITNPIPDNLDKYYEFDEYISHTDSTKSVIDKVYQIVRNFTLKKKLKLVNSLVSDSKKILDIGCGTGDFLSVCQNNSWTTIGVEPNKKARDIAQTKNLVIKEKLDDIVQLNENFDIITLWHVLEHVPNLTEYIEQLKNLLNDDGTLLIAVPNFKSYDAKYYKEHWAAYDVPRHIWHFSKISIQKIFASYNLKLIKTIPMKFDSFYVSLLSEKYKSGKMNPLKAFFVGLTSNRKAKQTKEYSSHIYLLKKAI